MAEVKIEIIAQDKSATILAEMEKRWGSAFKSIIAESQNVVTANSTALNTMSAETKNYTEGSKSLVTSLKEHWVAASVAVYGAWMLIQKGLDLAKLGAKAQQSEESFKAVTRAYGEDAGQLLSKMKEVSVGLIDDSALMQRAVKGLQQGLSGEQITSLLEIARTSARTAAVTVVEAFDRITDATANQMTRGLKSMGIVVDQNKAFEDQARALGTVTEGLTEMQQSQALANAAITEGRRQMEAMGPVTKNASEIFQEHQAQLEELKETIGKGLIVVFEAFGAAIQGVAATALLAGAGVMKLYEAYSYLTFNTDAARDAHEKANAMFEAGINIGNKAGAMIGKVGDELDGTTDKLKDEAKNLSDTEKAQIKADKVTKQHTDSLNLLKNKIKEANVSVEEFGKRMGDLDPDLNETAKKVADVTQEVQKMKQQLLQNVGQNVLNQLTPQIDAAEAAGISNIYKQQLKDFNDLMTGMSNARKEGIIKDLAEIDKSLVDETKKFGNNSVIMTAIALGEDLKRIDSLKKWKDSLITMHNEAIAKAREYQKVVEDLNMTLSKGAIWRSQFDKRAQGDTTSDQSLNFQRERQVLQLTIDQADRNPTQANLLSKESALTGFIDKNKELLNTLEDIPGKGWQPIWQESDFKKLIGQFDETQIALGSFKDAAQSVVDTEMSVAMKLAEMFKPADTAMDLLKTKFTDYVDLISVQRQVTLDTSPAVDSIQAIINKTTEALGYIQQLNRYNTSSTSAMSGLGPAAQVAPSVKSESVPVLAGGTPFVRKAGYAWVDPGERVMTADQNKSYSGGSGGKPVTISPNITMNVNGVTDPNELARQVLKPLNQLMREYNHLIGGN